MPDLQKALRRMWTKEKSMINLNKKIYNVFYHCKQTHLLSKEKRIFPEELTELLSQTVIMKSEIENLYNL